MYKTEIIYGGTFDTNLLSHLAKKNRKVARESTETHPKIWTMDSKNIRILDAMVFSSIDYFLLLMDDYKWKGEYVDWDRWCRYPVETKNDYIVSSELENGNADWRDLFIDNGYEVPDWAEEFVSESDNDSERIVTSKKSFLFINIKSVNLDEYPIYREFLRSISHRLNYRFNSSTGIFTDKEDTPTFSGLPSPRSDIFHKLIDKKYTKDRVSNHLFEEHRRII